MISNDKKQSFDLDNRNLHQFKASKNVLDRGKPTPVQI